MTQHSEQNVQTSVDAAESRLVATNDGKQRSLRRRDLRSSLIDGVAFGGMVGFGAHVFGD